MSNYTSTPSFGGSSSYPNQWPPANPLQSPMPSILPPNFPFPPDSSSTQNASNNTNNFDANSRLPGLGVGAPGPLPPPPFPFSGSLAPSQFPPAPFPLQMPLFGYPPIPLPMQTQTNPLATNENTSGHTANAMGRPQDCSAKLRLNNDQEEGEITDGENVGFPRPEGERKGRSGHVASAYSPVRMETDATTNSPTTNGHTQNLREYERTPLRNSEEGGASVSRASSRASGSPYNPPMSVTAASPVPEQRSIYSVDEKPLPPVRENEKEQSRAQSTPGKSPDQLRIQAQGALLSLAPHNIRFEELVGEGINPALLRQLYEEVGIKVPTLPVEAAAEPASFTNGVGPAQRRGSDSTTKSPNDLQKSPVGHPASDSQSDTIKPMERKEVIARMLAAKAAKASGPSPSPQATISKETSTIPDTEAPLSEISGREREIPVREKNKAQTELARQRIEQLKKQGLMRNQKAQQDPASQEQPSRTAIPSPSVTAGQHPPPERPPEREGASARLPGLFMTGSNQIPAPGPHATPTQNLPLDPTPQPRAAQRKRPRASDFDEINDFSRRGFSHGAGSAAPEDRLVIDISDDEFYGENEDDAMDTEESQPLGTISSSTDFPTSLTPRNNDQEHLRQKDIEIQEMHRKIAELEQRKKAKLVSNHSQSPRVTNTSSLPITNNSIDANIESENATPADPAIANEGNGDRAEQTTSESIGSVAVPPTKPLASMDSTELQTIRSKILRKQKLESGLPKLDAEIASSEAKLFLLKQEEDNILSAIAIGKQGRQQLIRELEDLGIEINGLTLDELDAAQRKLESDQASFPAQTASPLAPTANEDDFTMADIHLSTGKDRKEFQSVEEASVVGQEPQTEPDHDPTLSGDIEREASHAYSSDSTGSSMDESTDTSSVSSDSDSQGELEDEDVRNPRRDFAEAAERPVGDDETHKETDTESHPPLSEHATAPNDGSSGEESYEPGDVDGDDRMSSVESEGYEPPEPEQDSDSVESEYTPPPHSGKEPKVSPEPLPDQSPAEPQTGGVQEVSADSGHVQNAPEVQVPDHKFTPYKSPLRHFKSYRYHPNYSDLVSEGYRSLTYSHNIDSMKHLCPFESAGGICNDRSCEYQHFDDMTLSDDKILVQMGSLREGKTPEEKDQYIAGLKQIINDMRRDKVKDFNTVATEIAAYRRRFLHDPTRVLPL